jgi:hypothetical protein
VEDPRQLTDRLRQQWLRVRTQNHNLRRISHRPDPAHVEPNVPSTRNSGSVTVSPSPQSKEEENDKLHELRRYARDFRCQHTTDAERFEWDSDDEDYGLAIGRLVVT